MAMSEMRIRPAELRDLACLTEIYNYYVVKTPVTFDRKNSCEFRAASYELEPGERGNSQWTGGDARPPFL